MATMEVYVNTATPQAYGEGTEQKVKGSCRAELCVIDFLTEMALEGRGFQVRAGTITTPITGDVVITDTKAEMAVEAPLGTSILPVYLNIGIRLGTGTLHEYALKSVAAAITTNGGAFIPLPTKLGGGASRCTAGCSTAGGMVVAAELNTTTRCLWAASNPVAVGAGNSFTTFIYQPAAPHVITGIGTAYVQIAATGTGPDYYATLEYIEIPTVSVS
jgi:hypothetical protein